MVLSRIWAAFIIVAIVVASYKWIAWKDSDIFNRMVVGKADDANSFYMTGDTTGAGITKDSFARKMRFTGFTATDKIAGSKYLIADNTNADSISILKEQNSSLIVMTYAQAQKRLQKPVDGIIETCWTAVNISLKLIGIMALFMGFMNIAERAGGIRVLSRIIGPFFSKLFPELPKGHPAMGHMMMNFSANLLNLDNAATPFGLKAMESLQELNPNKAVASNAQIMFLALHASGLTLIPVTIIAWRSGLGAQNATDIFIPCMIATFVATLAALIIVSVKQKINLLQPVILSWLGGLSLLIALLVMYVHQLQASEAQRFSSILSNGIILFIFVAIVIGGVYKRIDVFDAFAEGAKGGFETAVKIIPYIVGMLVAISMLRTSGVFDVVINGMKGLFAAMGTDTRFVDGLPTALIKPMSGSGARGMMIDTMKTFGADSFAGRLACILQGSSDTTFYVIAVYFGSVAIKNTRYAVTAMLLADLAGIIASILLCYLFFG